MILLIRTTRFLTIKEVCEMKKYTEYQINNRYVNIADLDRHYQGNMEAVCQHIQAHYLVDRETALYYVNLYIQDKPFKLKDSTLSTIAICFCFPLVLCAPLFLVIVCIIVAPILSIIDLATKSSEKIPKRHVGSVVALVICGLSIIGFFI